MRNEQFEQNICATNILLSYMTTIGNNEIVHINDPMKNLYGFVDDSYIGKKCEDVLHGFYDTKKIADFPMLKIGKPYEWYKHNEYLNLHFALTDTLIEDNGLLYRMTIAYDISYEVDEISQLQDNLLIDKSIVKCAETLISTENIDDSINMLLKNFCEFYGAQRAYIFEIDYKNKYITNTYEFVADDDIESLIDELDQLYFDEIPNYMELLYSEKELSVPYIPNTFKEGTPEFDLFYEQGVESMLTTRLYRESKIIGFLGVDNPTKHFNDDEFMSTVAAFIVNELQKRRDTDKLKHSEKSKQKSVDFEQAIVNCAKTLFDDVNIDISINKLLEIIALYFGADRSYVFEIKEDENYLCNTYEFCNGNVLSGMAETQHVSVKVLERWFNVFEEGKKCIHVKNREVEIDSSTAEYKILVSQNVIKFIIVPLYSTNNKLIGFFGIDNYVVKSDDVQLLDTAGIFVVNNIEKRDMIKELEFLSYTDKLTGLANRNCYLNSIENIKAENPKTLGVVFGDVNGLKKANDKLGHEYGDILIKWCANFLKRNLNNPIYRIGGDEFVCFIEDMECDDFYNLVQGMRNELFAMGVVNMSMGGTWHNKNIDIDNQIIETDKIMYLEKQKYYILKKLSNKSVAQELRELEEIIDKLRDDLEN